MALLDTHNTASSHNAAPDGDQKQRARGRRDSCTTTPRPQSPVVEHVFFAVPNNKQEDVQESDRQFPLSASHREGPGFDFLLQTDGLAMSKDIGSKCSKHAHGHGREAGFYPPVGCVSVGLGLSSNSWQHLNTLFRTHARSGFTAGLLICRPGVCARRLKSRLPEAHYNFCKSRLSHGSASCPYSPAVRAVAGR